MNFEYNQFFSFIYSIKFAGRGTKGINIFSLHLVGSLTTRLKRIPNIQLKGNKFMKNNEENCLNLKFDAFVLDVLKLPQYVPNDGCVIRCFELFCRGWLKYNVWLK